MSGTQAQVEVVLTLSEKKRAAWRALRPVKALRTLAALPKDQGCLELSENTRTVTARAFFADEGEALAEMLLDAFVAAAPLGARGKGVYFVLVDYQREEGHSLEIADGKATLTPLPARKARARHAVLDALLEKCVAPPPPPPAAANPGLERASAEALVSLRAWPAAPVAAIWQRVKSTTITGAAAHVTKKQDKQLLDLLEKPPAHWEWARALPIRLMFACEPEKMEPIVRDLLGSATLQQQERWMLVESFADSKSAAGLAELLRALDGEQFLANAARGALARSVHPDAASAIVDLARAWLARSEAKPRLLGLAPHLAPRGTKPYEAEGLLSLLGHRQEPACVAMLLTIWERLFAIRDKLTDDGASVAVRAAYTYVESASRVLEPAVAQRLLLRFPHMFVPLEKAQAAIDALHRLLPR